MKIYILVKETEVTIYEGAYGNLTTTETEVLESYTNEQDARCEMRYLREKNQLVNIDYDVVESELNGG